METPNTEMVFDPSVPDLYADKFQRQDWSHNVYSDAPLDQQLNMPKPWLQGFIVHVYVDSDHAGDTVTRRSRTGFFIYCNNSLVYCMSKKQGYIDTSSFGSEFVSMRACTEYIRWLKFKLQMMGIQCDCPAFIYGDNQSVLANSTMPHSMLKKKSNSIAYHFVREGTARNKWRATYINTNDNQYDLLTKILPHGENRTKFCNMILHQIWFWRATRT